MFSIGAAEPSPTQTETDPTRTVDRSRVFFSTAHNGRLINIWKTRISFLDCLCCSSQTKVVLPHKRVAAGGGGGGVLLPCTFISVLIVDDFKVRTMTNRCRHGAHVSAMCEVVLSDQYPF